MSDVYAVVEKSHNIWNDDRSSKIIFKSLNLLEAYDFLLEQEAEDKAISMHNAGSPINISYQIDTYKGVD